MIRAAIFDLGGVVYRWPGLDPTWADRVGVSHDEFLRALYGGNDEGPLVGRVSAREWWEAVGDRLGIDRGEAARLRHDFVAATRLITPMVGFIRSLRPGLTTAFLSNAWSDTRPRLEQDGIHDAVDEIILSCEVGIAKPDPEIYRLTLERLQVGPSEAIFVDDAEANIAAARDLGMLGVVARSTDQVISDVETALARV